MSALTLIIGNKNYSAWSLRPWLAMRHSGIAFEEILVPLLCDGYKEKLLAHSAAGKVPILKDGETTVWESLAILEYVAERFPDAGLLPDDPAARATARAAAAEMHAGFLAIRGNMPMNLRKSLPGRGRADGIDADVARVCALWNECRARFGQDGPFLFGRFSIADAMYVPLVTRLRTYDVAVDDVSAAYCQTILNLPAFLEWEAAGKAETWIIEEDEVE